MADDAILRPRHANFKDLTGSPPFGRLTVLAYAGGDKRGRALWTCRCACGTVKDIEGSLLRRGQVRSCGCLSDESRLIAGQKNRTHGHHVGHKPSPEYQAWTNMKRRCYDPTMRGYEDYGGRGLTVCKEWLDSFEAFLRSVGPRPGSGYSVERVKNEIGYQDGNVIWATAKQQANNRRSNRPVTYQGRTMNISAWAEEYGIARQVLRNRIAAGWPIEKALTAPVQTGYVPTPRRR